MTSERRVPRICSGRKPAQTASRILPWMRDVPRSFEPNSRLAYTEGCLSHAVLCEAWEEPFEGPLSNLVADFCSSLFLKTCVAVYSQGVVDTANSHTLSEEGKFRLRVLASCSSQRCRSNKKTRKASKSPARKQEKRKTKQEQHVSTKTTQNASWIYGRIMNHESCKQMFDRSLIHEHPSPIEHRTRWTTH